MTTVTELKQEIIRILDQLCEEQLVDLLDHARWLLEDEEVLTEDELQELGEGLKEIERGEYVTLEELKARLDM